MEITSDQIRKWLLESFPESSPGEIRECFASGPFQIRHNSRVYYAECANFPSPILAKLCLVAHTLNPDPAAAQRQYDALLRVGREMGEGAEFSVPKPFLLRADVGLLAMEWIPGSTMTDTVFSWECSPGEARQFVARAGRWLKRFHECLGLKPSLLDVEQRLGFVSKMEKERVVTSSVFLNALNGLRTSARNAGSVDLNYSWIHGDFKTDNLIVSGSRTIGIDFDVRHENAVVYDLATFLNHLELSLIHPRGWRLARSRSVLRRTFLESYCEGSEDSISAPLTWLQLSMIVGRWFNARVQQSSWPRSRLIDTYYGSVASRLTRRIAHLV